MGGYEEREGGYTVPTYKASQGAAWYHFLHGNVPGHQIDFMYRPEVPQGLLTRQHFSHLSRLIKYIEPHTNNPFAFAIGNLSRDDTQYEPGHGGLGMIFGFRIEGVTDHAGRLDPPFAHGIATVDRNLDAGVIFEAARSFYEHLFSKSGFENPSTVLYQEYVRLATKNPSVLETVLKAYVEDFSDLPKPGSSSLTSKWLANEAAQPKRVVVVHPNDAPFRVIAQCAARIAAMLYQSNIKWSAITNGRESDLPGGVTVRLVAKRDRAAYESEGLVLGLDEVPEEEEGIAERLFGAGPAAREREAAPVQGWRARMQAQAASAPISTPPPPMPSAGEEGTVGRYGALDSGDRSDPTRGGALADAEGAVPAPSSRREGDRGGRPWVSRAAPERTRESPAAAPDDVVLVDPPPAGSKAAAPTEELREKAGVRAEGPGVAPVAEDVAAGEQDSRPTQSRSRVWVWAGLALLCVSAASIFFVVTSTTENQPSTMGGAATTSTASSIPSGAGAGTPTESKTSTPHAQEDGSRPPGSTSVSGSPSVPSTPVQTSTPQPHTPATATSPKSPGKSPGKIVKPPATATASEQSATPKPTSAPPNSILGGPLQPDTP
jgi:hypothetical protein